MGKYQAHGKNCLTTNLQYWSTKQGKNQHHVEQTDEAETTAKDIIEDKNNVDVDEVGPVVDKVQPTLDEELSKGNSSRQTAPKAREECPRQLDPLGTLKTRVAPTTSQSGFWGNSLNV